MAISIMNTDSHDGKAHLSQSETHFHLDVVKVAINVPSIAY